MLKNHLLVFKIVEKPLNNYDFESVTVSVRASVGVGVEFRNCRELNQHEARMDVPSLRNAYEKNSENLAKKLTKTKPRTHKNNKTKRQEKQMQK